MRVAIGLAVLTLAGATAASADSHRLSDAAYIEAARCVGLASSAKLGSTDAGALKSLLNAQGWGRDPSINDRADEAQQDARRQADHADDYAKQRLQAELSGQCAALKG